MDDFAGYESWMRSNDNGVIGEARTKALLLDRFWVLERSIDAEGADHIIQRKNPKSSLLGPIPPRLGFIQSKFRMNFESGKVEIKMDYLCSDNKPKPGFFLAIHTGYENEKEIYFFTSTELYDDHFLDSEFDYIKKIFTLSLNSKNIENYRRNPSEILNIITREMDAIEIKFLYDIVQSKYIQINRNIDEPYHNDEDVMKSASSVQSHALEMLGKYDDILANLREVIISSNPKHIRALVGELLENGLLDNSMESPYYDLDSSLENFDKTYNWSSVHR
ncbi:hypothetical protein [Paenibacillus gallinarum]|uniref:DUF4365 domain-containing protein n=1 Tax=Paenibacillus gallinarum TaxID=2762232 RepID=A0ABR8T4X4_9BACL|nr:hypothetical protein [Paenibacillus gallinarum]MBD7970349.1 hypothetical protein [Paenibacillus gallinarum]